MKEKQGLGPVPQSPPAVIPAEVFPPGEYLRDELDARGWNQQEFARILARPPQFLSELIAGHKELTPDTAHDLANALGTTPEFWSNLEAAYRLSQFKRERPDIVRRAKLFGIAPVCEMIRRGWIKNSNKPSILEKEILEFFGISSLDETPELSFAARKSADYSETTPEQRAWMMRAKHLAGAVSAATFHVRALKEGMAELKRFTASEHDTRRVPKLLAEMGIRLVIIEHLAKTKIDGATLWLDNMKPVVALSLRFDRIDSFWFTLFHELSHVLHGDRWSLDNDLVGENYQPTAQKPDFEQRADQEAAESLIPQNEIENFILRIKPLYSKIRIVNFASRIKVHPGIVVGQLQRKGEIQYSHSREMLVKVRDILLPAALSDGWGYVPPI